MSDESTSKGLNLEIAPKVQIQRLGKEKGEVPNVVYIYPLPDDPRLTAKAKARITKNEVKLYFTH